MALRTIYLFTFLKKGKEENTSTGAKYCGKEKKAFNSASGLVQNDSMHLTIQTDKKII
jgi:hypothetical protein